MSNEITEVCSKGVSWELTQRGSAARVTPSYKKGILAPGMIRNLSSWGERQEDLWEKMGFMVNLRREKARVLGPGRPVEKQQVFSLFEKLFSRISLKIRT